MPAQGRGPVYEFGPWEIDLTRRELRAHGVPVPIGGRAFEIIEALVEAAGEFVTKDDLMSRVWSGAIVEESVLHVHISAVRKALGPDRGMLKTAYGRGYRLLGRWTVRRKSPSTAPPELETVPSAIASALDLKMGGDEISPDSVARAIGGRKLLIVLDNCEHIIEVAARLAETLVRLCPHTSILATSREILRIECEHVYAVPPLDVPLSPAA
jgi:DNA-binding winged helix-turn-helix (wHTH) protein